MTPRPASIPRRRLIVAGAAAPLALWWRPAAADAAELEAAIRGFAGAAAVQVGRVTLDIAPLVENGNAVPVSVGVDSPMSATDHVKRIALFNERNPQREVAVFHLGPHAGRASIATRIRLATSQQLVALAEMSDGSVWSRRVDVIVTLAACIE
ncbi:SoxY-related AACIE arm protein [uncultured Methylibium sp.]|uniref:SoxY-related AACIE arm protein n=1 Tax=uncultured Methylibium sp. TaxID=381093 RepID=UPI0025E5C5DC|nr:SoxY-related AACIE arm protein [uncultured Methylibium sp.]